MPSGLGTSSNGYGNCEASQGASSNQPNRGKSLQRTPGGAIERWLCLDLRVRSGEANQSSRRTLFAIFWVALAGTLGGFGFVSVTEATAQSSVDLLAGGDLRIDGATAQEESSYRVAPLGDMNGDGRSDVVLGAPRADANGRQDSGSAYVVFGQATRGTVDLAALTGKGFRINGAAASDLAGTAVAGLGDVNGDGKGDLAIGAPTQGGSSSVYVIFGGRTSGAIDLANLGAEGFRIVGLNWGGKIVGGVSVEQLRLKETGDMNGDGRADIVVSDASSASVVFGKSSTTIVDLANLGSGGFRITGMQMATSHPYCDGIVQYCIPVARLSDVNGDGAADVLVGDILASNNGRGSSGSVYVIYGKGSNTTVDVTALGSSGYRIDGAAPDDRLGVWAASAGDVNGDARDDLLLGARNKAYVVFTKANLTSIPIDLALGFDGYRIDGSEGYPVAGTGDVNGDDIPDALVGDRYASVGTRTQAGRAYLVFGKKSFSSVPLQSLGGLGYQIDGAAAYNHAGWGVAGTGDVNGGGKPDLMVGAPHAGNNGRNSSGSGWILYGSGPDNRPVVTLSGKLKERENKGLYDPTYDLRVVAQDGTQQQPQSGVKSIEIQVDGIRRDYAEQPCPNGNCAMTRDFVFRSDDYPDGDHTVRVMVRDLRGNQNEQIWTVTVDRRGDIYHAIAYTADPAVNGEEVIEEWAQYATLNARQVTEGQVTTRDSEPCGSSQCGVVRSYSNPPDDDPSAAPGYTSFTGASTTDARLEQVSELLAPANESLGPVLQSGPIAQALAPWQTAPPAHGSSYSLHEIKEPEDGTGANVAVTRLWIDAATKLPLKEASLDEDGVAQAEVFYTYDRDRKTSAEVAADIFRVPPPADGSATEHWNWGTGNVPPDNPEGSDQDDELALATDFRRSFGLTTDPALILSLLTDPSRNPDAEEWGTPLTASEKQTMDLRVSVSEAIGVIQAYGRGAGSSEYGGLYIDQANGGLVYVGFAGNAGAHLANLRSLFPYPDLLRTFTAGYTETQLYGTADAVSADKGWLASQGIDVLSISPSMKTNRVEVGVAQPTPASAAVLQSRYGSIVQQVQGEELQEAARFKLYGGLSIVSGLGAQCAAGFSARSTGTGRRRYFGMTAGHCSAKGRIWYGGLREIGRTVFSQHAANDDGRPEHQRNVDIGYIKYKSRSYRTGFIRGNSPRDLRPIYSYDRYPRSDDPPDSETHEGEPVCIAGWKFKNVHCGTVTKRSTEHDDVHSLVEMEVNGGGMCRGESGAPAFYRSRAVGTFSSFFPNDEDAECGRRVVATQIEHALNRVFAKLLVRRRP